jgi:hypothetical protein
VTAGFVVNVTSAADAVPASDKTRVDNRNARMVISF